MIIISLMAFVSAIVAIFFIMKDQYFNFTKDRNNFYSFDIHQKEIIVQNQQQHLLLSYDKLKIITNSLKNQSTTLTLLEQMHNQQIEIEKQELEACFNKKIIKMEQQVKKQTYIKLIDEDIAIFLKNHNGSSNEILQQKIVDFFSNTSK